MCASSSLSVWYSNNAPQYAIGEERHGLNLPQNSTLLPDMNQSTAKMPSFAHSNAALMERPRKERSVTAKSRNAILTTTSFPSSLSLKV